MPEVVYQGLEKDGVPLIGADEEGFGPRLRSIRENSWWPVPELVDEPAAILVNLTGQTILAFGAIWKRTDADGVTYTASDDAHFVAAEDNDGAIIIIEGPISAIDGNIIIIFDLRIQLNPDDPLLLVIRVGDIIRVEGNSGENNIVIAIIIIVINVDIYIGDGPGDVYRDDGQCGNPPPPWAPAHGWRRKCQGTSVTPGQLPPGLRSKIKIKITIKN